MKKTKQNARHLSLETQAQDASEAPANQPLKSSGHVPGSSPKGRHLVVETQNRDAASAPATKSVKPRIALPGSPTRTGRHRSLEAPVGSAASTPAIAFLKPMVDVLGSSFSETIEAIRAHHRERRFAMGIQQVLDRKLESFIRINKTDWHVGDDETTRDKANKEVAAKIKAARKNEGDPSIMKIVRMTDDARAPADAERARHEREMETLARSLPVAPWVESVPGFGLLGLATIIAETGDLALYPNVAKVWKRLGYAPYKGHAGSSWKRQSWRNGDAALTAEEWIANPFSGRRYSLIHVISIWLKNKQWIGAAKSEDGVGKPNGKYGEVYAARRAHTAVTHPDWSKQHNHMDGLRVMMKAVLKDLWLEWTRVQRNADGRQSMCEAQAFATTTATPANRRANPRDALPGSPSSENGCQGLIVSHQSHAAVPPPASQYVKPSQGLPGASLSETGRHHVVEAQNGNATVPPPASDLLKPNSGMPGASLSETGRHHVVEAQNGNATATPATQILKPRAAVPGSSIQENGCQSPHETQVNGATATPVNVDVKPKAGLPGSSIQMRSAND